MEFFPFFWFYSPIAGDPPEPEELIKALLSLENSASSDANIRERIANLPPEVSEIALLTKLEDKEAAAKLIVQVWIIASSSIGWFDWDFYINLFSHSFKLWYVENVCIFVGQRSRTNSSRLQYETINWNGGAQKVNTNAERFSGWTKRTVGSGRAEARGTVSMCKLCLKLLFEHILDLS